MSTASRISPNIFFWLFCVFLVVLVKTNIKGEMKTENPRLKKASCGHERDAVTFIVAMRYWINAETKDFIHNVFLVSLYFLG